jgi:hypothetical protein
MRILKGSEDARSILAWADDISRVINGLGVDQPVPAYTLYTQCMRGTALSTFENRGPFSTYVQYEYSTYCTYCTCIHIVRLSAKATYVE